ncbi:hypothetical protein DPEC_G00314050 [Dallia pectoralis]|uniref:Uncharacterized protein n=1 Tax=Dallia pectoralis TaxID=75939 RepID=A0ACC2FCA5_DALPE|nr:hypothetical protein DPEC_G00314050 [Dallia pectoralis]
MKVPHDEWSGYPGGGKDDEIPCRRMRSSSYVKAMGDEESGESDSSPKTSPVKSRPDALVKSAMLRPLLDSQSSYRVDNMNSDVRNYINNFASDLSQSYQLQASREMHPHQSMALEQSLPAAQFRSRNQSYMRAVSTLSQASCVSQVSESEINGQFESVCESVFSEVESQAVEALDLPGCFRTRSHSYLRAIQAGYSQDDDCIPSMSSSTVTSTIRSTAEGKHKQEATSLPAYYASVRRDVADTVPLAHDDLGCPIRRDWPYRQDSIGATAEPESGPPVVPSLFRPPKTIPQSPERPSPKAIQASIKESAHLAAAISMQWKEEVSAMRRELSDLRRDLCTELRAFNSNFNTFAKHYNTWSPQPGAAGGTGDTGKRAKVVQVSVGTQARSKVLVRQSTADVAVNCPEESEAPIKQAVVRRRLPKQISMDPAILRRPASMFVEGSIPITLDQVILDPVPVVQTEPFPVDSSSIVVTSEPLGQNTVSHPYPIGLGRTKVDPAVENPQGLLRSYPWTPCSPDPASIATANVYRVDKDNSKDRSRDDDNVASKDTDKPYTVTDAESIHSTNVKRNVQEPSMTYLSYTLPVVTVSPPQESDADSSPSDAESVASPDPASVCLSGPETFDLGFIVSSAPEIEPPFSADAFSGFRSLPSTNKCSFEQLDQESDTICPTVIITPESPTDLNLVDVRLSPSDQEPQDLATACLPDLPDLPDPIPINTVVFQSGIVVHAYPVTVDSFDEFDELLEPEWPPCPEPADQATECPSDPFVVHLDLTIFNSSDESDLDSVFLDPPEPLETGSVSSSDLSPVAMYTPPDPVSLSPPSLDHESTYLMELMCEDPAIDYQLGHTTDDLTSAFTKDTETQLYPVTLHSPGPVSLRLGTPSTTSHPEPLIPDPASFTFPPFGVAPVESEDAAGGATDPSSEDACEETGPQEGKKAPGTSHCDQTFLWDRWQQKMPQWEPRSMKRSSSVELWSGRYEYNSAEITYMSLTL